MTEAQRLYHTRRAAQELERAAAAATDYAGRIHRELAELHAERSRGQNLAPLLKFNPALRPVPLRWSPSAVVLPRPALA